MNAIPVRRSRLLYAVLAVLLVVLAGCRASQPAPAPSPARKEPAASQQPPGPPAEPGAAPAVAGRPPGQIVDLPNGAPEGAVFDPASRTVAIALRTPERLALLNAASGRVRTVPAPGSARHLDLASPGHLLVPGEDTDQLAQVSLPSGQVTEHVQVGRQPHDAVRVGHTVFVANELGRSIGVVRAGRMVQQLRGLTQPGGITATGGRVAAIDVQSNTLHIFDARTLRQVAVLPAGQGPSHVRPLGHGRVAVADTRGNAVLTYRVTGHPEQLARKPVPGRAYGLDTDRGRGYVYATLANVNKLVRLPVRPDGTLGEPRLIDTVRQPNDVTVDPKSGTIFVIGRDEAKVQELPLQAFDEETSDG